jgi:hypothetical protein
MLEADFQELMRHHPELRPLFEHVPATRRYQAHWRVKGKHKLEKSARSPALLKTQIALGEAAFGSFGGKGFDENGLPVVASKVQQKMKGKRFKEKKKLPTWEEMVQRIKREREALVVA